MKIEIDKIYNIDCIEGMNKIEDEQVDLVVIDPPFNSETKMASPFRPNSKAKMSKQEWFIYNNMSSRGYISWMNRVFSEFYRVLKEGSHIYVFCNWKNIRNTMDLLEANFFVQKDLLTWDKEHFGVGFFYRPQTEFIIVAYKGLKPRPLNRKNQANIFREKRAKKAYSLVQKPHTLIQKLIELSSNEGDLVLDCFMCSGTTAIASRNTNRRFIGFEINKENFNESQKRLSQQSLEAKEKYEPSPYKEVRIR